MATIKEQGADTKANGAPAASKYKASDLPLPSATSGAIESLAHAFKKEGAYDDIRRQVWDKFEASVSNAKQYSTRTDSDLFFFRTMKHRSRKRS